MTRTWWRRCRNAAAALALAVLALVAAPTAGSAAPPAPGAAFVRLAHLSPDAPAIDVYLASVADPDLRFTVPGVAARCRTTGHFRSAPTPSRCGRPVRRPGARR